LSLQAAQGIREGQGAAPSLFTSAEPGSGTENGNPTTGTGGGLMAASTLTTNQNLGVNDYLTSPNALCCAVMQGDGNFVIYTGSKPFTPQSFPVWATNKQSAGGKFYATMQGDGNFVVYAGASPNVSDPIWASNTVSVTEQYFLALSDVGQLSINSV
jgi:hypothetical protein